MPVLCLCSDWTIHCVLHYEEQGLWGVVSGLVSCSPWVLAIFLLAFYHTCWSGLVLVLQLYQVNRPNLSILLHSAASVQTSVFCLRAVTDWRVSFVSEQIAFLGLTTAERTSLTLHQRKLRQSVSLRQNPYK